MPELRIIVNLVALWRAIVERPEGERGDKEDLERDLWCALHPPPAIFAPAPWYDVPRDSNIRRDLLPGIMTERRAPPGGSTRFGEGRCGETSRGTNRGGR